MGDQHAWDTYTFVITKVGLTKGMVFHEGVLSKGYYCIRISILVEDSGIGDLLINDRCHTSKAGASIKGHEFLTCRRGSRAIESDVSV